MLYNMKVHCFLHAARKDPSNFFLFEQNIDTLIVERARATKKEMRETKDVLKEWKKHTELNELYIQYIPVYIYIWYINNYID